MPGVRPTPRVRADSSPLRRRRWWSDRVRGLRCAGPLLSHPPDRRPVDGIGQAAAPPRRERWLRPAPRDAAAREAARVWNQSEIGERLEDTVSAWESWSELHQAYVGPWRDLVHQSGRVLQALSFEPTGAICAAATTSLPEVVGGTRNWDYRYSWVRDASFTIQALWVAACPDEANEFFDYVSTSAAGSLDRGGDLQIMFGIGGERDLTERELPRLEGWQHSVPVRVGNGAWRQRQIDVYGELLNAAHRLSDHLFDTAARRVGPLANPDKWGAPKSGPSAARRPNWQKISLNPERHEWAVSTRRAGDG